MEKIVKQTLLFDFYGELLTDHQKHIYSDYVFNDIGISEIAAEQGITRQGVHDLIKRCDKILEDYEDKLKLLEKFLMIKEGVGNMRKLLDTLQDDSRLDDADKKIIADVKLGLNKVIDEL